jgi:RimJ/RimL family protein N-acetyltransferase
MRSTVPDAIAKGAMSKLEQPRLRVDDQLLLRPWDSADVPAVVVAFSDPDIVRWHTRQMRARADAERWVETQQSAWGEERSASFAIVDRHDDSVLGRAALHTSLCDGVAEIAYWVLPSARRRGVAIRAGHAITAWGHDFGFHRIELEHSTANEASCRVAIQLGYSVEGIKRGSGRHSDGWHDMHLHAHLATDADV